MSIVKTNNLATIVFEDVPPAETVDLETVQKRIETRRSRSRCRTFPDEELLTLWKLGLSDEVIAKQLGVSRPAIIYRRDALELPKNTRGVGLVKLRCPHCGKESYV